MRAVWQRQRAMRLHPLRSDKPLLLAICLKEEGRDTSTFQEVINQVLSLGGWDG